MNRRIKRGIILLLVCLIPVLFLFCCSAMIHGVWYTTDNTADYGKIKGNKDNKTVEEFMMSFFPQQLEPYFENVVFSYKANNQCSYKTEMHLEFKISDSKQFQSYVAELTDGMQVQEFAYDANYNDYIIHNHLYVEPASSSEPGEEEYYFRNGARMGRILVCEQEQRIIFEGILAYTCCGGYANEFDFYNRYGIDPQEYSDRFCDEDEIEFG